jgi:hypothetical protein
VFLGTHICDLHALLFKRILICMEDVIVQFTLLQVVVGSGSIVSALLWIAWTFNGRFTKIETDVSWLKNSLKKIDEIGRDINELRVSSENKKIKLFEAHSPVRLTSDGQELLKNSGLKAYIDANTTLVDECITKHHDNAYEVQEYSYMLFDSLEFESAFDKKVKQYAFDHGISLDIVKRVGALYFRDICLTKLDMNDSEIDTHKPHLPLATQT